MLLIAHKKQIAIWSYIHLLNIAYFLYMADYKQQLNW